MKISASRYLEGFPEDFAEELKAFIEYLQTASFEQATTFYQKYVPMMAEYPNGLGDQALAFLAANDRFFLMTELMGRKWTDPTMSHPWIYAQCREVEAKPDGYVDLWAREHGKSSIITCAGSIQEIIRDPEITIGIFSINQEVARGFVRQIVEVFENNADMRRIFRDVFWENPKQAPLWSRDHGITVKRKGHPREPTLSGWGLVDAMPTGYHFKLRIYDDVINERHQSAEMCSKATERWELSDNLSSGDARFWAIGTRYFQGDPYEVMIDRGVCIPRLKPATDDGTPSGNPVYWSKKLWEAKRRTQRITLAAQLLQNPLADGHAVFDPLTLKSFLIRPKTLNVYILGDYAGSKSKTSDMTAYAVIGIDSRGNKYLLDGFCHRMSLTEKWTCLRQLYLKWKKERGVQSVFVAYERYGAQSDIQFFENEMLKPGEPKFPIEEVGYVRELNEQSKKARVSRLEPDFAGSEFYVPAKVWRPNASWWVDPGGREHSGPKPETKEGQQFVGPRVCLWSISETDGRVIYKPIPMEWIVVNEEQDDGTVRAVKRPPGYASKDGSLHPGLVMQKLPAELAMERAKQGYRIVNAIKRFDSEIPHTTYDVTHMFFEQFKSFPKSTYKDFLDAMSRIYDVHDGMGPTAPMFIDETLLRTPEYID